MLVFIVTIYKLTNISFRLKTIILILYLVACSVVSYIYIVAYYNQFSKWLLTFNALRTIFYGEQFPIYVIDIIGLLFLFVITFLLHKYFKNTIHIYLNSILQNKKIQLLLFFLIAVGWYICYLLIEHAVIYILYFLVPSVLLLFYLLYILIDANRISKIVDIKSIENYTLLISLGFLSCCLAGSYTLQLINISLHSYLIVTIFILLISRTKNILYLKYLSIYLFMLFIQSTMLNPFIYATSTVFKQDKEIHIKSTDEKLWVNHASKLYYEQIEQTIGCCDSNKSVLNIDYTNVLYYLGFTPYLLPNIVDEQSATIFHKEIQTVNKLKPNQAPTPTWMFTSNSTDTHFYYYLKQDKKLVRDSLILKIEDPMRNIFKNLKSDKYLYIYSIKEVDESAL